MNFSVRSDRMYIRTGHRSNRFVLVNFTAPDAPVQRDRRPANLALVLDRSGSMAGTKIELARRAVDEAIDRLKATDRFAVVVYDDKIDVVAESVPATTGARRLAAQRLREIDARGSTNLFEGWMRGCEQVALHLGGESVNRTLLLTDGLANVGITDRETLETHASELRARGVSTSTFGVGNDFDEALLQGIADAGGGHFYYIEQAAQIPDLMSSEVGETLEVVARDASLEVTMTAGMNVDSISPFPCSQRGDRASVSLGDLVSGQELAVVLRVNFPYGVVGHEAAAEFTLRDRDGALIGDTGLLRWQYADDRVNDGQQRDRDVDRAVARMFTAKVRQEAVAFNRSGHYREAAEALQGVARRIRGYAGDDPELNRLAGELVGEEHAYAAPMPEAARKQAFYQSANLARTRDLQGKAVRRQK